MSKLNRKKLQKMILQEFKMMGMKPMQSMGKIVAFSQDNEDMMPDHGFAGDDMGEDALMGMHSSDHTPMMGGGGSVSREDCCAAIMCMIECCSCEVTKAALMECCQDIMSGDYDR